MERLEFFVDIPPAECSQNTMAHRLEKYQAQQLYKAQCVAYIYQQFKEVPQCHPCRITTEWWCGGGEGNTGIVRPLYALGLKGYSPVFPKDYDNAVSSLKYMVDAIRDSGMIPDDSLRYLRGMDITQHRTKSEHCAKRFIKVTLERVEL